MKGTRFGTIHTDQLGLVQQSVTVGPAVPRLNLVDVPGRNGSIDLSEAHGTGMTYQDRTLTWVFALRPGQDWATKRREVENALNGRKLEILLDDEPGWLYTGRVSVTEYKTENLLRQITVEAICNPYKRRPVKQVALTVGTASAPRDNYINFGAMPLVPDIIVAEGKTARVVWNDHTYDLTAGRHSLPEIFVSGEHHFSISGTGTVYFEFAEGSL